MVAEKGYTPEDVALAAVYSNRYREEKAAAAAKEE